MRLLDFAAFPKDPEIQLSGPLEVGKPVTVKCLASDVYPSDRLEMELFKGDQLLKTEMFIEEMEKKSLETKSLEVTFTPGLEDIGKALVCRASLHIEPETQKRQTVNKLQVHSKYLHEELWSMGIQSQICIILFIVTINVSNRLTKKCAAFTALLIQDMIL